MSKLLLILLIATCSFSELCALHVQGKIVDEQDEAIPYASVAVIGTSYGTVSNLDGEFELVVRQEDSSKEIAISFVGYETAKIAVDTAKFFEVVLRSKAQELPDAFVIGFEARELIEKFENHKALNYPQSPMIHKMFLREHEKTATGQNIYLSELIVDYLRYDYLSSKKDKMRIIKGRNFQYIDFDSVGYAQPAGGFFDIGHDLVKYPAEFISASKADKYNYEIESAFENNGSLIYKVKFSPNSKKSRYIGYLYFEDKTFALLKAEVSYDEQGMEWLNSDSWSGGMSWSSMKKHITYSRQPNGQFKLAEIVIKGEGYSGVLGTAITSLSELVNVETVEAGDETQNFIPIDKYLAIGDLSFEDTPNFWEGNNFIKREEKPVEVAKRKSLSEEAMN